MVLWEILSQEDLNLSIRDSILWRLEEQALLSRILQMAKSVGFKSGKESGHNSFGQKLTIFLLHHSWTRLAVWDVASTNPENQKFPYLLLMLRDT